MNGRIAIAAAAAAALVASLTLGPGAVRASDDEQPRVVEKRVVVGHGGGRLGVSISDTEGDVRGALVRSVSADSAAEKAGLKEGDVITRFDGEAVRSASQLSRLVAETPAARTVAIEVTRAGATQKLQATLAEGSARFRMWPETPGAWSLELPDLEDAPPPPTAPHGPMPPRAPHPPMVWDWRGDDGHGFRFELPGGPRKLGIEYMELGDQLAAYFKLSGKSGVLVTAVEPDGPAAKAGIKAGDVILALGGDKVKDGGDLREALSDAEGGSEVTLSLQRDGRPLDLKVTLAKPAERRPRREARGVSL